MSNESLLTREQVMPLYVKELVEHKRKKLVDLNKDGDQDESIIELETQLQALKDIPPGENIIFKEYLKALLNEQHDLAQSILEILEASYLPKI